MEHIGHPCLQIFPGYGFRMSVLTFPVGTARHVPDGFDAFQQHLVVKRFHDIVIRPFIKGIFCNFFLSHCRDHDKIRSFVDRPVLSHFFHYGQSVHFRHDQIKKNNIRLSVFNDLTHLFAVFRFPDEVKLPVSADDLTQDIEDFLVIICNGHTQLLHLFSPYSFRNLSS